MAGSFGLRSRNLISRLLTIWAASAKSARLRYAFRALMLHVTREISIDTEGGIRAIESNARFIAPIIKLFIGEQAIDQERNQGGGGQGQAANRSWRALAGASGFGVIGSVASRSLRPKCLRPELLWPCLVRVTGMWLRADTT